MSTDPRVKPKLIALSLGAILALALGLGFAGRGARHREARPPAPEHPGLFGASATCPRSSEALRAGRRLEERARLRADRYPYSAREGVRAVLRFEEAAACYRIAGARRSAARSTHDAALLSGRVQSDYAAARLNLGNALAKERWTVAVAELRRLRSMTEHVEAHQYVDWLEEITGRVEARAAAAP